MVTEVYSRQLKWFAQKLLELRAFEDGYGSSIIFKPSFITENDTIVGFNTTERTPEDHIIRMLKEVRHILIKEKVVSTGELYWTKLKNGNIEIDGYTTDLIRIYFKKYFGKTPCLFGEGQNDQGKQVITYCGILSDTTISGNPLAVFRCLQGKFGKDVSFEELHDTIRITKILTRGPLLRSGTPTPINRTQKAAVQSAINELSSRLKAATNNTHYPEIIENIRGIGYKMII